DQAVGNIKGISNVEYVFFRQHTPQDGHRGTLDIQWMRRSRQRFHRLLYWQGQPAQAAQLGFVRGEFSLVGQFAVDQQVSHFLEFAVVGQVQNVVAAVVQVVAA